MSLSEISSEDIVITKYAYINCRALASVIISEIIKNKNNILIDAEFVMGGRLACLCLNTNEKFYV